MSTGLAAIFWTTAFAPDFNLPPLLVAVTSSLWYVFRHRIKHGSNH